MRLSLLKKLLGYIDKEYTCINCNEISDYGGIFMGNPSIVLCSSCLQKNNNYDEDFLRILAQPIASAYLDSINLRQKKSPMEFVEKICKEVEGLLYFYIAQGLYTEEKDGYMKTSDVKAGLWG